eukprot:1158190-Pelagomonas_calceolata.AAC.4
MAVASGMQGSVAGGLRGLVADGGVQGSADSIPGSVAARPAQLEFYPGTGQVTDVGIGDGRGYTLNIPWQDNHGHQQPFLAEYAGRSQACVCVCLCDIRAGQHGHQQPLLAVHAANQTSVRLTYEQDNMVTDGDYLQCMLHVVLPVAHQFQPDMIVVAAGFDAAHGDFFGTSARYAQVLGPACVPHYYTVHVSGCA